MSAQVNHGLVGLVEVALFKRPVLFGRTEHSGWLVADPPSGFTMGMWHRHVIAGDYERVDFAGTGGHVSVPMADVKYLVARGQGALFKRTDMRPPKETT